MIEPIMYFGIGFLVAALIGLIVIPLVHGRAVRLTMRRLEAATPVSIAEIQADKDQLRAEFAMSTRRLEMSVEQLKAKSGGQLAELGKKTDAVNVLKMELGEKTATILALEARDQSLREQMRATEEEVAAKAAAVQDVERELADKQAALDKLIGELSQQTVFADAQKIEITSLKAQIEAFKERLGAAGEALKTVEDRREAARVELRATSLELDDERAKVELLVNRVAELEQQLSAQRTEVEMLGRHAGDLERQLSERSKLLAQTELEVKHLNGALGMAWQTEAELRAAIGELEGRVATAAERFDGEKTRLQSDLDRTVDERDRLSRDLAALRRETEEAWASERVENSLLRERINDVAAEVVRLASALEGPNSPIDAILATETKHATRAPAGKPGNVQTRRATAMATSPTASARCARRPRAHPARQAAEPN